MPQRPIPVAVAALLFVLTLVAAAISFRHDYAHQRDDAALVARQVALALDDVADDVAGRLYDLAAMIEVTGGVDDAAFRSFTDDILKDSTTNTLAWLRIVRDEGRGAYERRTGRPILERDAGGGFRRAARRASYVVIEQVAASDGRQLVRGVDVAADPDRRAALDRAAQLDRAQLTRRVRLVTVDRQGYVVYAPVGDRDGHDAGESPVGFVSGTYNLPALQASLAPALPASGFAVRIDDGAGGTLETGRLEGPAARATSELGGREFSITVATSGHGGRGLGWLTLAFGTLLSLFGGLVARHVLVRNRAQLLEARARTVEAEERFQRAFRDAPIGMALLDLDLRFQRANASLARMLGRPADELEGMTGAEVAHPDDAGTSRQPLAELLRGERSAAIFEKRYLRPDGSSLWASVHASLLTDDHDETSGFLMQFVDIGERRAFEAQLEYLAGHDPLTGLPNRRRFDAALAAHIDELDEHGSGGALLMLDLDHFKNVNDILGHQAGDRLITELGEILRGELRDGDTVARLGGDEFAILLPHADEAAARTVAHKLIELVREYGGRLDLNGAGTPTLSVGIALFAKGLRDGDAAVAAADRALYAAKAAGRDGLVVDSDAVETH